MSEQHLATEYTACQYHIQTIDMRLWQSGAILIGASFASVAVLSREGASVALCVGLGLASVAAAIIFGLWIQLSRRRDAAVEALETRQREIESKVGMRKVTYLALLRSWDTHRQQPAWQALPPEEQATLERLYHPLPSRGATQLLNVAALLAMVGWPALAIGKIVELALQ
jgi:hypothetical protein